MTAKGGTDTREARGERLILYCRHHLHLMCYFHFFPRVIILSFCNLRESLDRTTHAEILEREAGKPGIWSLA